MVNIVCLIFITPIRSKPTAASSSKDRLTECFDDQRCFRQIRSGGVYSLKKFVDFYDDTVLFGGWWQCNFCLLKESTRFCPTEPVISDSSGSNTQRPREHAARIDVVAYCRRSSKINFFLILVLVFSQRPGFSIVFGYSASCGHYVRYRFWG